MTTWRMTLLGGIHVEIHEDGGWRPAEVEPKRLALLAYLAVADHFHTRDSILALLWPDRPERLARLALRQSLHHLTARLGSGLVIRRGRQLLGLDRDRLSCDVHRFEEALRQGRFREAVAEYQGDFLKGFVLSSHPDAFEDWIKGTRLRLLDGAITAITGLSQQGAEAPGTHPGLGWVHQALALSPYSEALLRRAVDLRLEHGDRGGAMREIQTFSRRLWTEMGLPASDMVLGLGHRAAAPGEGRSKGSTGLDLPFDGLRRELAAVLSGRAQRMERSVLSHAPGGESVTQRLIVERRVVDGRTMATVRVAETGD